MSQVIFADINPSTKSGTDLAADLNAFKAAIISGFSGTVRPPELLKGGYWVDTSLEISQNLFRVYFFDGTSDILYQTINKVTGLISFPGISSSLVVKKISADVLGAVLDLYKTRGTGAGGQVLSGDQLGGVTFSSTDDTGAKIEEAALIEAVSIENHTGAAQGTRLDFYTKFATTAVKKLVASVSDGLALWGSTSGYVLHKVVAAVTSYTLIWPAAQGAANTYLKNDGAGNLSWATAAAGWTKYTIGHAALQTAALTNNVALLTLPIKGIVEGIVIKTSTSFGGGVISAYTLSVGITGDEEKYMPDYDALAAVSGSNYDISTVGAGADDIGATEALKVFATSVGANLSASTAGSVDIYVKTSTLP